MKRNWLWLGAGVVALAFLYGPSLGIDGSKILWALFLLACPLLHFFGFHGLGRHGQGGHSHGDPGGSEPNGSPRQLKGREEA